MDLEILLSLGILVVQDRLGELLSCFRVETQHPQPAVEEHGAAGNAIDHIVLDQHAAVHRPDRLELFEGHHPPVFRRSAIPPDEVAVRGIEAVDMTIGRPEQGTSLPDGRWRVDAAAAGETPQRLARIGVKCVDAVCIDRGDKQFPIGDDRRTEFAAQLRTPRPFQAGGLDRGLHGAAARRIVPEGRPVARERIDAGWICVVGRSTQQTLGVGHLAARLGCRRGGRQRRETGQLRLDVAGARMLRCVDQPVAGHDAVMTGAADPVVADPVFRRMIDELDARPREEQVLVGRLGSVAAMVEPVRLHVRREFSLHFPGVQVAAGHGARIRTLGHGAIPDQAAGHQNVVRRPHVSARMMRGLPQRLPVLERQGEHGRFASRRRIGGNLSAVKHHVVVQDQRGAAGTAHVFLTGSGSDAHSDCPLRRSRHWIRSPSWNRTRVPSAASDIETSSDFFCHSVPPESASTAMIVRGATVQSGFVVS